VHNPLGIFYYGIIMDNTILLIDGSSFIFRAFHAMPNLTSPDGKPTGAIYGIINMLKQMQKRFPTQNWICVFDAPGKTFRDHIHPEYKANRAETPSDLIPQFKDIYLLIDALGIPVVMQEGIEADDIIGTLAMRAKNSGYKVVIATGDKDFAQLVDNDIILVNTMTNEVLDIQGVIDKFGVTPAQIIDYLSLVGDKADNISGVDKCGPKTASKWLAEYKNIDNLIANQNKLTGVVGDNFRKAVNWLTTAKELVTINTSMDLNHDIPHEIINYKLRDPKIETLIEAYQRLGFKGWLKQLTDDTTDPISTSSQTSHNKNRSIKAHKTTLIKITNADELDTIVSQIYENNQPLSLTVIPNNFAQPKNLRHILFSQEKNTYSVEIAENGNSSNDLFAETNNTSDEYISILKKLFNSSNPKLLPNYKDSLHYFTHLGLTLNNVYGDLTLAHYIQDSKDKHSLSSIYKQILDIDIIDIPSNISKLTRDSIWLGTDSDKIINNLHIITENCMNLEQSIVDNMSEKELNLYRNIELPLASILVDIENQGIKLDIPAFKQLEIELTNGLKTLENNIYADAKCVFNINSAKQLQDVLFNQLKLPTDGIKKNANGYSTDEDSLNILQSSGANIAKYLLEYRTLSKLLNTYVAKLPLVVDKQHKVHTTYEQAVVASGRLSSKEPNLQNIPVKHDLGRRIRSCFIADHEHMLICADYSQIELRVLAHISQDENLIQAFNNNLDIHAATASGIFHKALLDVTKDERRYAKTINFSLLYGKTVFGLAQELGIDRVTAKIYIDTYFAKYPKIKTCLENIKLHARENGYVETVMGRRIYLPNITASNRMIRDAEERLALNAPMQGTSADIIKVAMINISRWLDETQLKSKVILQIHDELIIQAPESEVTIVTSNLARLMTDHMNLTINLAVDVKIAKNWDEAH
jgi:DNA polymerase I